MSSLKLVIVFVLVIANSGFAVILNVPEDFETIQAGINQAEDGDSVLVSPGVYEENITINTGIVLGSLTLITGDPAYIDSTVIDGRERGSVILIEVETSCFVRGFSVRNGLNQLGGGIYVSAGTDVRLHDLMINDNNAEHYGGGVAGRRQTNIDLLRVTFTNNHCGLHGAGLNFEGNKAVLEDCSFTGNLADGDGGGLRAACDSISMRRVLVAGNQCRGYGNVKLVSQVVEVDQITIVDNIGSDLTGGLVIHGTDLSNSIIRGNSGAQIFTTGVEDDPFTIRFCDIEGGEEGINNHANLELQFDNIIDDDPLFVDPENGDYHLTGDSPCIDAGDPESDPDPDGTRADMGAFYHPQRDIAVEPPELNFPPIGWGQLDSLPFTISNEGFTDLTIESIMGCRCGGCFWMNEFDQDLWEPIVIEPEQGVQLWVYYQPEEGVNRERTIFIHSDDPDEPEVIVQATGEVNGIGDIDSEVPLHFQLNSPYPNPFNSSITISYNLPTQALVTIEIYNTRGQLVDIPVDGINPIGNNSLVWDAKGVSAGVYLINLRVEGIRNQQEIRKVILVR